MIRYIKGTVTGRFEGGIILENHGIGYEISMPSSSSVYLAAPEEEITVYTYMAVREDAVNLYGFDKSESLEMFLLLITVSGVGSKAALSILSTLTVREIKKAILFEDSAMLTRAQGIGKKSASRILLELKDKIKESSLDLTSDEGTPASAPAAAGAFEDAVAALVSLGYSKGEASDAVSAVRKENASAEDLIKGALKQLSIL